MLQSSMRNEKETCPDRQAFPAVQWHAFSREAEAAFGPISAGPGKTRSPGCSKLQSRAARAFGIFRWLRTGPAGDHWIRLSTKPAAEMVILRGIAVKALRAPSSSASMGRLRPQRAGRRSSEVGSRCRRLRQAAADPGADDWRSTT